MSKPVLKYGSKGKAVRDLIKILQKLLPEDESYDPDTDFFSKEVEAAVQGLQAKLHLKKDGVVGKCCWNAFDGTEKFAYFTETTPYTDVTAAHCWKVSTYFLLQGKSGPSDPYFVTAGPAETEINLLGLGGIKHTNENMALFAKHWHLTLLCQPPVTPWTLAEMIRIHGRVMLNAMGKGNASHFVCVCGIRGDGTHSGTTVSVMDPLETSSFQPDHDSYAAWCYRNPGMFYQVLFR